VPPPFLLLFSRRYTENQNSNLTHGGQVRADMRLRIFWPFALSSSHCIASGVVSEGYFYPAFLCKSEGTPLSRTRNQQQTAMTSAPKSPKIRQGACHRRGTVVDDDGNELDQDRQIFTPRSFRIRFLDVFHGVHAWTPYLLGAAFIFAISRIVPDVPKSSSDVSALSVTLQGWGHYFREQWLAYGIIAACMLWLVSVKRPVYLVDFAVFEPPVSWKVSKKGERIHVSIHCYSAVLRS
jgi:hypothetical protein